MKTNTVTTTPNLTLSQAVTEAINELKLDRGSFSAHDVTNQVRSSVNAGEYNLPGLENPNTSSGLKYFVEHNSVKDVIDGFLADGTLKNLGLTDIQYGGGFQTFVFDDNQTFGNTLVVTPTTGTANPTKSPVEEQIENYLTKVGSVTLKQVQSRIKVNGITCKDLCEMVKSLGFTVTEGTPGKYSTYVVG